jgi:hypothetical protein
VSPFFLSFLNTSEDSEIFKELTVKRANLDCLDIFYKSPTLLFHRDKTQIGDLYCSIPFTLVNKVSIFMPSLQTLNNK